MLNIFHVLFRHFLYIFFVNLAFILFVFFFSNEMFDVSN